MPVHGNPARGRLLTGVDAVAESEADRLAATEMRGNDKQDSDMRTQLRYIPARYHYWAGVAVAPPASSAE
jgi:hypothetical protein